MSPVAPLYCTCHGHRHWCIKHQGPRGLRLLFGCALVPGPGLGTKGSWGLKVLLGLDNDQGIPEEEEVPLPYCVALCHMHALVEQWFG